MKLGKILTVTAVAATLVSGAASAGHKWGHVTYQKFGNITYGNNGEVWQRFGNIEYGRNNRTGQRQTCQTFGTLTYCN